MSDESGTAVGEWPSYGPPVLASLARYWVAIVLVVGAATALGFIFSLSRAPVYEATATIFLSNAQPFAENEVDPQRRVEQEANRLTSGAVFDAASESLGRRLRQSEVTVGADPEVGLLEVTAISDDPEDAATIANTVTGAYEEVSREAVESQLDRVTGILDQQAASLTERVAELADTVRSGRADAVALETAQAQLTAVQTRISEIATDAAIYGSGVEEVEQAIPPSTPASPKPIRDAAMAGVVALAFASAAAYWRAGVVARSRPDPSEILGAPLLAHIPEFKGSQGGATSNPMLDAEVTESYQFLVTSLEFALAQSGARSILVTSASAGDGKSVTALHLARALAIQGRQVMLVDSDIRAGGLTTMLKAENQRGLVSLAEGEALEQTIRRYRISSAVHLSVIPSGPPPEWPTGLLATARYRDAMAKIIAANDLTIFDGSPLLPVADASAVAAYVDGILLVLDSRTPQVDLMRARERLRLTPTPLLGYVLNRVSDSEQAAYPHSQAKLPGMVRRRRRFGGASAWRRMPAAVETVPRAGNSDQRRVV